MCRSRFQIYGICRLEEQGRLSFDYEKQARSRTEAAAQAKVITLQLQFAGKEDDVILCYEGDALCSEIHQLQFAGKEDDVILGYEGDAL